MNIFFTWDKEKKYLYYDNDKIKIIAFSSEVFRKKKGYRLDNVENENLQWFQSENDSIFAIYIVNGERQFMISNIRKCSRLKGLRLRLFFYVELFLVNNLF